MSIIDKKKDLYGKIAAFRTSCENYPKLKLTNSFSSINNCGNSLDFLLDLIKSTIGFEALNPLVSNIITFELDNIEIGVKKVLKLALKEFVSCGVNPSIPDFFKHENIIPNSSGVNLNLRDIDYLGLMLIEPTSKSGRLLYSDVNSGLNSKDFNTYLFETIQLDGTQTNWGSQTLGPPNDVLSITFNSVGVNNNMLTIKASEFYSNPINNKKLTDLNNDYIDSINLFNNTIVLNTLFDSIYGTISFNINKTKEQIKKEIEIENILECVLNVDDNENIDDNFFKFTNEIINQQEEEAINRSNGVKILKTCNNVKASINIDTLTSHTVNINTASTKIDKSKAITKALNEIADETSKNVSNKNKITAKLDFINNLINKLIIKLGSIVLSPKVMTIFALNHYILYGTNIIDPIEWMKKNKTFLQKIINNIRDSVINILLNIVIKEIKKIVSCTATKIASETAKLEIAQISSLLGIPQETLRIIQGLA